MGDYYKYGGEFLSKATTLSPRQVETLKLLKLYEGDYERVAEEMDISEGAVRSMKSKALEKADTALRTVDVISELDDEWADRIDDRTSVVDISISE